ncbi:hypothetical protein [Sulfuracidifex metallicus]|uniref:Uncharacterized protein n=1 Tax=Sulfuracidifex metallicus DSM 6482 = JCM 9184 TaxID=523847 RepID=A0A6A9QL72_SULME|nr:hypothetical protein [Sulfuracidifex metallicus]MUN30057.1 hypothetical protein [Sulfuracidifex metallicus DSM 6482 = JCM 9184]WOE51560.1 hypothetical protein RQ359_000870 [Sulfuracidifex metallicus DSM 6482 = JCM 9184]
MEPTYFTPTYQEVPEQVVNTTIETSHPNISYPNPAVPPITSPDENLSKYGYYTTTITNTYTVQMREPSGYPLSQYASLWPMFLVTGIALLGFSVYFRKK